MSVIDPKQTKTIYCIHAFIFLIMNKPRIIPDTYKYWAKHLRSLVGGECAVTAYYDEPEQNEIDIFTSVNSEGILASTIGLMDYDQSRNTRVEIHSEIIMDRRGKDERIANILSTIAFYVIKDGWKIAPGVVFEEMVKMYIPESKLPHVMFVAPFQWSDMSKVVLSNKTIFPLIAVPISEQESRMAASNNGLDLETLWQERSIDVLDWERSSAV